MQVFSNCLRSSGRTGIIASEEEDVPVAVEESYSGNYVVVFDPGNGVREATDPTAYRCVSGPGVS